MSTESEKKDKTPTTPQKIEGDLRFFDPLRGYGFIKSSDGSGDVLLPIAVLQEYGINNLYPGDHVTCEIMRSSKGMLATRIIDVLDNLEEDTHNLLPTTMNKEQLQNINPEDLKMVIVKWYDDRKGYGFAIGYDIDNDIMLSRNTLRTCGIRTIFPGDKLNVTIEQTEKGLLASYVEYK